MRVRPIHATAQTLLGAALCLLLGQGCATATAGIAASNVPIDQRRAYRVVGQAQVVKRWWSFDSGFYSAPFSAPPLAAGLQELAKQYSGDALLNVRYSVDRWLLPLFTLHQLHLKADVVRFDEPNGGKTAAP